MKKNYVYLMITSSGSYEDYHEFVKMASLDKGKVQQAVDEYNKVLKETTDIFEQMEKQGKDIYYDEHGEEIAINGWQWLYLFDEHSATIKEYELT